MSESEVPKAVAPTIFSPWETQPGGRAFFMGYMNCRLVQINLATHLFTVRSLSNAGMAIVWSVGGALVMQLFYAAAYWYFLVRSGRMGWGEVIGPLPARCWTIGFRLAFRWPFPTGELVILWRLAKALLPLIRTLVQVYSARALPHRHRRERALSFDQTLQRARDALDALAALLPEDQREATLTTATDDLYRRCNRCFDVWVVTTSLAWGMVTIFLKERRLFALPTPRWWLVFQRFWGAFLGIAAALGLVVEGASIVSVVQQPPMAILVAAVVLAAAGLGGLSTWRPRQR